MSVGVIIVRWRGEKKGRESTDKNYSLGVLLEL